MRIAVGGFQHETNTFAPSKAELEDFTKGGGWPPLSRGEAMFGSIDGVNLPAAGFVEAARERGWTPVPLAWAGATPSSYVTDEAFETIAGHMLDGLEHAGSLDAVYLDLHGAMVTESHEDGEGELLRRVRNLLGPDIPILVSLDLHANVTPEMMALATALVSYRTYPHVDQAVTGKRAARLLDLWVERGGRAFASAFRQLPFLIPLTSGCSLIEPAKAIYDGLDSLEIDGVDSVSFNAGFSPADIHHAGPTVTVFGSDQAAVDAVADGLASSILAQEAAFAGDIMSAADGVAYAKGQAAGASRPIVLWPTPRTIPGPAATAIRLGSWPSWFGRRRRVPPWHCSTMRRQPSTPISSALAQRVISRWVANRACRDMSRSRCVPRSPLWAMAASPAPGRSTLAPGWTWAPWRVFASVRSTC